VNVCTTTSAAHQARADGDHGCCHNGDAGRDGRHEHRGEEGRRDGDRDRLARAQPGPEEAEERTRGGNVAPVLLRVAQRVAGERADERREVPAHEDHGAREPEPAALLGRVLLRDRDRRRLVDRQLRRRDPARPTERARRTITPLITRAYGPPSRP
jgi:hypothetical protein